MSESYNVVSVNVFLLTFFGFASAGRVIWINVGNHFKIGGNPTFTIKFRNVSLLFRFIASTVEKLLKAVVDDWYKCFLNLSIAVPVQSSNVSI